MNHEWCVRLCHVKLYIFQNSTRYMHAFTLEYQPNLAWLDVNRLKYQSNSCIMSTQWGSCIPNGRHDAAMQHWRVTCRVTSVHHDIQCAGGCMWWGAVWWVSQFPPYWLNVCLCVSVPAVLTKHLSVSQFPLDQAQSYLTNVCLCVSVPAILT